MSAGMPDAGSFALHAILKPGASMVLALGVHAVGAVGAAARARQSIEAMSGPDWRLADSWARRERAEGVLSRAMTSAHVPGLRDRWSRLAMVADFRQARLRDSLIDALGVLESADLPRLLLKGSALACAHYAGGFQERPMEDVDILVPPEAAEDAHRLMVAADWRSEPGTGAASHPGHHHLPALRHPETGHILELHRSILAANSPFAWNDQDVWRSAVRRSLADGRAAEPSSEPLAGAPQQAGLARATGAATALVPSAEDLLLHAAVHLSWAHELRVGLWGCVRDVVVLASAVSWPLVVDMARERGAESAVYWPLRLGVELGGAIVDLDALERLRPVSRSRARTLARHYALAAVPPRATPGGVRLSRLAWRLGVAPRGSGTHGASPWESAGDRNRTTPGEAAPPHPRSRRWRGGSLIRELRGLSVWLRWAGTLLGVRR